VKNGGKPPLRRGSRRALPYRRALEPWFPGLLPFHYFVEKSDFLKVIKVNILMKRIQIQPLDKWGFFFDIERGNSNELSNQFTNLYTIYECEEQEDTSKCINCYMENTGVPKEQALCATVGRSPPRKPPFICFCSTQPLERLNKLLLHFFQKWIFPKAK